MGVTAECAEATVAADGRAPQRGETAARLALLAALVVLFVRTAWVCDDAYITLRTVEQFLDGHGLRWNVAERVQSYTHPLWMVCLLVGRLITGELYFSTLLAGILVSTAAVWLLVQRHCDSLCAALLAIAALAASKAFVDYSTSGLENPLSHVLLLLFLARLCRGVTDARALREVALLAALAAVNRMDLVLFFVPALIHGLWRLRRRAVRPLLLGFLPLFAWEAFALVYYGFPFPNTAYAKIGVDLPAADLWHQGLYYWLNSLRIDPITPGLIVAGLCTAFATRAALRSAALGGLLYALYVTRIGGDFMSGRHFTTLALLGVVLLVRSRRWQPDLAFGSVLAVILFLGFQGHGAFGAAARTDAARPQSEVFDSHQISDERAFYYPQTGLLSDARSRDEPDHVWARQGTLARSAQRKVEVIGTIGFFGVAAGPSVHVIDSNALSDPLLARIPRLSQRLAQGHLGSSWRIGHYERDLPPGYQKTLESGSNQIEDADLAAYFDALALVTRGPLFSSARWSALVRLNLGRLNARMEAYVRRLDEDRAAASRGSRGDAGNSR